MKLTHLFFIFFLLFQTAYSQQLTHKCGAKILNSENKKLTSYEIKTLYAANPEAWKLYKKGKLKKQLGNSLMYGGGGLAIISAAAIYGSDSGFSPIPIVAGGAAIAGIVIKSGFSKKIKASVDTYNSATAYEPSHAKSDITLCAGLNTVGLKITF